MQFTVFDRRFNANVWRNVQAAIEKEVPDIQAASLEDGILNAGRFLASGSMWHDDPGSQTPEMRDWAMLPDHFSDLSLDTCVKIFTFLAMFACTVFPSELEQKEVGGWGTRSLPTGSPDKE